MTTRRREEVGLACRATLHPRPPYSFTQALTALHYSPSVVLDAADPALGVYRRALRLAGRDALVVIRARGEPERTELELEVRGAEPHPALAEEAIAFATRVFRLDVDPAPFEAMLARDPVLGALVARFPGLRPILSAEPFEALIFAVIGQQINVSFARTLKRRLVEQFGGWITVDGSRYPLFPAVETLAALAPADLLAHQFSRQKADYIVGLARAVAAGDLDLAAVGARPFPEALAELTRHRGIGRWTAEYLLLRGYGADDSIPAGDLGLRDAIGRAYIGRRASEAEVREVAARWAPHRGWAAFYWWLSLHVAGAEVGTG